MYDDIDNELVVNSDGSRFLSDRLYKNDQFRFFCLQPRLSKPIFINNVIFDSCKVTEGGVMWFSPLSFNNVTFNNFNGGKLIISSKVVFDNVKISGNHPDMIWIKKIEEDTGDPSIIANYNRQCLDISDYDGEVSITDYPIDFIRTKSDKQVVVSGELSKSLDWEGLGLRQASYWRLVSHRAATSRVNKGVFSMPAKSLKNYELSMKELGVLRKLGYIE